MISTFATNFLLGLFHGHPTELSAPGLVRFNVFKNVSKYEFHVEKYTFLSCACSCQFKPNLIAGICKNQAKLKKVMNHAQKKNHKFDNVGTWFLVF